MMAMVASVGSMWTEATMWLGGAKVLQIISLLAVLRTISAAAGWRRDVTSSGQVRPWADSLLACAVHRHGGSFLTALLLTHKAPGWATSPASFYGLLVGWYLVCCCPGDAFYRFTNTRFMKAVNVWSCAVSKAHCIATWGADAAVASANPAVAASPFAAIIAGTLVGCGGGVLAAVLRVNKPGPITWPPPHVSSLSPSVPSSALLSMAYVVLADPWGYWFASPPVSHATLVAAIAAVEVATTVLHTATGFNVYGVIMTTLRAMCGVPATLCWSSNAGKPDATHHTILASEEYVVHQPAAAASGDDESGSEWSTASSATSPVPASPSSSSAAKSLRKRRRRRRHQSRHPQHKLRAM